MPMITSMLDTDLYKLTMMQVVLHQFPDVTVEYEFKLRNYPIGTLDNLKDEIDRELNGLCDLRFSEAELDYLETFSWFKPDFIEFLRMFSLNKANIRTWISDEDELVYKKGEFRITIKGLWLHTILFETPVLAIVSEILTARVNTSYSQITEYKTEGRKRLMDKIDLIIDTDPIVSGMNIVDFGTRRRLSKEWHEEVIETLAEELPANFIGTSNVLLAMKHALKPIGTMAHEFIQAAQALTRLEDSQKFAFDIWAREYRGELGIALSDCLGFDAFLNDFDMYFCKLFDGARHDSGDPYEWCDKLIQHYENYGIDPTTKTAVFSDGLDFPKAIDIYNKYNDKIKCSFGIGTNITNDTGFKAPQIVIKMTQCNRQPVAKISDSKGKMMCKDQEYLNYLASVFNINTVWRD